MCEPTSDPAPFVAESRGSVTRLLDADGAPLDVQTVWTQLRERPEFRVSFARLLASSPFDAFFWETPPLDASTLERPYEHVLLDARRLAQASPDPSAFEEHFRADADVVVFPSLRGDATLVVPCPRGADEAYGHLASFLRVGPPEQVDALFATLAETVLEKVGLGRRWVSTSGLGVPWLHVRLDTVPKYYQHSPYAEAE